ncbi:MAG: hypothetical protein WC428_00135 [Candidatus Paceibacterota bacterium]
MKRIVLIIGIMLLTDVVFAQTWKPSLLEYFVERPQYALMEHESPESVEILKNNDINNPYYKTAVEYFDKSAYSFIANKKLYMLSYDTCKLCMTKWVKDNERRERGIYLFRLDKTGWVKASDKPVQIDYKQIKTTMPEGSSLASKIWSYSSYFPQSSISENEQQDYGVGSKNGSVTIDSDGTVTIIIVNHSKKTQYQGKVDFSIHKVVLKPSNDGTYIVQ